MALIRVKRHFQITLPQNLRQKLNINVGDYVEVEDQDGELFLRPVKLVRPDQEYFYTKEWQAGEAEADRDVAQGDLVGRFDTAEECIEALEKTKI